MAKRKESPKPQIVEPKSDRQYLKWLIAILIVHVILASVYWHFTKYGASPDESAHGAYIDHMVSKGTLPVYSAADGEGYEFYQPPLYYALGRCFGGSVTVRLLSLILGGLSITLVYAGIRRAFPDDGMLAVACAGFVALLPTHVMTSSMVSNDILMEAVFSGTLYVIADMLMRGIMMRRSVLLGVMLGVGILTKMTCLALIPVGMIAYLIASKQGKISVKPAMLNLVTVLIVAFAIGGWWFVRNQAVYGNALAMPQLQQSFQAHSPSVDRWLSQGMPPAQYLLMVLMFTFQSFWGVLGGMNVFMPGWAYWALTCCSFLVLVGIRRSTIEMKIEKAWTAGVVAIFGLTLALVTLSFLQLNMTVFQAQGRYLYPALVPLSLIWALGIRGLFPKKNSSAGTYVALLIPAFVQVVALIYCVVPGIPTP